MTLPFSYVERSPWFFVWTILFINVYNSAVDLTLILRRSALILRRVDREILCIQTTCYQCIQFGCRSKTILRRWISFVGLSLTTLKLRSIMMTNSRDMANTIHLNVACNNLFEWTFANLEYLDSDVYMHGLLY